MVNFDDSTVTHTVSVRDVLRFFQRSWLLIALMSGASILVAIVGTMLASPSYTASATVMFDPNVNSAVLADERGQAAETSARIDSQVEIIKSRRVALTVVHSLGLEKDPDFIGAKVTADLAAASSPEDLDANVEKAVVALTNKLSVRRIGQSTALEISFVSGTAEKAAKVANAIADAYIDVALQDKSSAAQKGANWLEKRLDYLRGKAFSALQQAENFKAVEGGSPADSRVKAAELESVAQSYRRMYDSFLLRYFQTEQLISYPVADSRLLSGATPGLSEKSPKKMAIIAFGAIVGAFAGVTLALFRRALDHAIKSPEFLISDPRSTFCGAIAHAGKLKSYDASRSKSMFGRLAARLKRFSLSRPERERLLLASLIENPPRSVTTSLRRVRAAIFSALPPSSPRIIGISSIGRGEGKTATAANLSALCVASGFRTLLIDACAENPSASRLLAPKLAPGLCDAIRDGTSPQSFVIPGLSKGYSFLPSGTTTAAPCFGDLVDGPRDVLGFEQFRSEYDIIFIDLPALSESSDAVSIGRLLDGVILVTECCRTREDKYTEELGWLVSARPAFIGCVLNKVETDVGTGV